MLSIHLLGGFTIFSQGHRVVDDLGPAGRMLAAFLFEFPGRAHRRERLADQFWGHLDPERSRAALNTGLWRLRKVLAREPDGQQEESLRTFGSEVALEPSPTLEIDTHRFMALAKKALALPRDPASCLLSIEETMEVYTGPFFDGEEADWILEERERLHSVFVRAGSELLRIHGHLRQYEEGIAVARRMIAIEPFRESIHRSLVVLLVLNGQRAEALRLHERWSNSFRRELGIQPMPQTLQLIELVRSGRIFDQFDIIKESYFLPPSEKSKWRDEDLLFFPGMQVSPDTASRRTGGGVMPHTEPVQKTATARG
jgi:DNA-binding SARP family transcriptional activator